MNVEALVSALAPECSWCSGLRCEFYGSPALSTEEWEVRTPHSWAETLHQLRVPAAGLAERCTKEHPLSFPWCQGEPVGSTAPICVVC